MGGIGRLAVGLGLALAVTGLVAGLRWWVGIEVGDLSGGDMSPNVAVGFVDFADDNLSYAAWAMQARQGHWLFTDLYAATPHPAAFFNPLFLLVGAVASAAGVHPIVALHALSLAAVPVATFAAYAALLAVLRRTGVALLATTLWLFAAGLGWTRKLIPLPVGSDVVSHDLHVLTTLVNFPYHALALAIVMACLALLLAIDRAVDEGRRPHAALAILILLAVLGTLARPYELPQIALAWFLYALWRRGPRLRGEAAASARQTRWRIGAALALGVALLPVVAYQAWLSAQPVWSDFAAHSLATGKLHPYQFLVGFALLWPLALFGLARLRVAAAPQARLLVVWFALMLVPMLFGHLGYAKLANGAPLVLAALAAPAAAFLWRRGRRWRLALVAAAILSLPSTLLVLAHWRAEGVRTVDGELLALVRGLPADAVILTDCETGLFLPALAGRRVWCGHWALTPDYLDKDRQATLWGLYAGEHVVPGDDEPTPPVRPVALREGAAAAGADILLAPVDAPVWLTIQGPVTQVGARWRWARLR